MKLGGRCLTAWLGVLMSACAGVAELPPPGSPASHAPEKAPAPTAVVPRVASANLGVAVRISTASDAAKAALKKLFDERQAELDVERQTLERERQALLARHGSPDDLRPRWRKLEEKLAAFQQEIGSREAALLPPIHASALGCAARIGEAFGLTAVVDSAEDSVAWTRPNEDATGALQDPGRLEITADVVRCMNGEPMVLSMPPAGVTTAGVDLGRALLASDAAARVKAHLKAMFDRHQADLDARRTQIQADRESLDRRRPHLSEAQAATAYASLQARTDELARILSDYRRDLTKEEQDLTAPLLAAARDCAGRVALGLGAAAVFEKSDESVVWAKPGQSPDDPAVRRQVRRDLTQDVVGCMNAAPH
jgi:Skp family chaperone for outer membrane proteins